MDLYRYFQPHHNPRLRSVPLRLQEVGELEQAAQELRRAVQRAAIRSGELDHEGPFTTVGYALERVIDDLERLRRLHPGDGVSEVSRLVQERRNLPGWEIWARFVLERLEVSDE